MSRRDPLESLLAYFTIAEAARRLKIYQELDTQRGLCCMREHANATPPWTCTCLCHSEGYLAYLQAEEEKNG